MGGAEAIGVLLAAIIAALTIIANLLRQFEVGAANRRHREALRAQAQAAEEAARNEAKNEARYNDAVRVFQKGEYEAAKNGFEALHGRGNMSSAYMLALMYRHGLGVERDYSESVRLLRPLAESGHAEAQRLLAEMYIFGEGVERNLWMAKELLTKALEYVSAGSPPEILALRTLSMEHKTWTQATLQKVSYELLSPAAVASPVPPAAVASPVPPAAVASPVPPAAVASPAPPPSPDPPNLVTSRNTGVLGGAEDVGGADFAQYELAMNYRRGRGVETDLSEAARLLSSLAEKGHPQAQYELGEMYATGQGVERDLGKAYSLIMKAFANSEGPLREWANLMLDSIQPELFASIEDEEHLITIIADVLHRIHLLHQRKDVPFCAVSCGDLYVQCYPNGPIELHFEAVSGAYSKSAKRLLTAQKLSALRSLGFSASSDLSNTSHFGKSVQMNSENDYKNGAKLALQVLKEIYEVESFRKIAITTG